MIAPEILSLHYKEYGSQPDSWVNNMAVTKRSIVAHILSETSLAMQHIPVRVVVLGASDKRYVPIHKKIFEELLGSEVDMKTLDLDTHHLDGTEGVIEHDVTKPFPKVPYDIVFSHELMKFLSADEQKHVVINSYNALREGGLAMHIMHEPSIKGTKELRDWQYRVNPDHLLEDALAHKIDAKKIIFQSESLVDWLRETTILILKK